MKLIKESYLKIKKNLSETVLAGKYRFCIVPSPTHLSPRKKIYSSFLQKVWLYSGFSPTPYPTLSFTACYFELYSTNLQLATWNGNKQFLVNRKCNSRSLKMYQHYRTVYTYNLNNNVNILTDEVVFCFQVFFKNAINFPEILVYPTILGNRVFSTILPTLN